MTPNKKTINPLTACALVRFSKRTGKVDTVLSGTGYAVLNLWGLQNTTKTKETLVFTCDGLLLAHYTGRDSGLPKVEWVSNPSANIESFCPGILATIEFRKDWNA